MPPELTVRMSEVIIHMDNPHMSGMTFLSCTVKPMFHRDAVPLTDATADTLHKALDKVVRKLNAAGCTVKMIRCNKQFQTLMDDVMDKMDIKMDHSDSGAHESVAEQNNRVTEEWHRTTMH